QATEAMTIPPASPQSAPHKSSRQVRLLDLMALIATVALVMATPAIVKGCIPAEAHRSWDRRQYVEFTGSLALWSCTAVALALWLARHRAALRQQSAEPGPAALIAATGAFVLVAGQQLALVLVFAGTGDWPRHYANGFWFLTILGRGSVACGAAIAGVWLLLAIGASGRRPSGWFSWLLMVLGSLWVFWALVVPTLRFLPIPWLTRSGIE
ncbi:hypothetical protein AB1L88_16030, partial [Tautonia sp. JC769]|uniref:hypothetical protein n=1 Tax=Tautonia sp. JC769 TaxID=3232135 RepID=UPI003458F675